MREPPPDNQLEEFARVLAEESNRHYVEINRTPDGALKLKLDNDVTFDYNKATIRQSFYPTLDKLVGLVGKYNQTVAHFIGHTDSIGSDSYNQLLSENRAAAVAKYFSSNGIVRKRILIHGRGESVPLADNSSDEGRQINRCVEIYLKEIKKGKESWAYEPPVITNN